VVVIGGMGRGRAVRGARSDDGRIGLETGPFGTLVGAPPGVETMGDQARWTSAGDTSVYESAADIRQTCGRWRFPRPRLSGTAPSRRDQDDFV